MNCKIIRDLLPLYTDNCCSAESRQAVEEHLRNCNACRKASQMMRVSIIADADIPVPPPGGNPKIQLFRASLLQSALFFVSFLLLTAGVAFEAATPTGDRNGFWSFVLIIPATGFLLSLANWYFIRMYRNKKRFSYFCGLLSALFILAGLGWGLIHYPANPSDGRYLIFTAFLILYTALSVLLSAHYAKLIGKE